MLSIEKNSSFKKINLILAGIVFAIGLSAQESRQAKLEIKPIEEPNTEETITTAPKENSKTEENIENKNQESKTTEENKVDTVIPIKNNEENNKFTKPKLTVNYENFTDKQISFGSVNINYFKPLIYDPKDDAALHLILGIDYQKILKNGVTDSPLVYMDQYSTIYKNYMPIYSNIYEEEKNKYFKIGIQIMKSQNFTMSYNFLIGQTNQTYNAKNLIFNSIDTDITNKNIQTNSLKTAFKANIDYKFYSTDNFNLRLGSSIQIEKYNQYFTPYIGLDILDKIQLNIGITKYTALIHDQTDLGLQYFVYDSIRNQINGLPQYLPSNYHDHKITGNTFHFSIGYMKEF